MPIEKGTSTFRRLRNNKGTKRVRTKDEVDREYLESVFEDRCFPREQANCNDILRRLGLDCYEPELICRKMSQKYLIKIKD